MLPFYLSTPHLHKRKWNTKQGNFLSKVAKQVMVRSRIKPVWGSFRSSPPSPVCGSHCYPFPVKPRISVILLDVSEEMPSIPCLDPEYWPFSFNSCNNRGPSLPPRSCQTESLWPFWLLSFNLLIHWSRVSVLEEGSPHDRIPDCIVGFYFPGHSWFVPSIQGLLTFIFTMTLSFLKWQLQFLRIMNSTCTSTCLCHLQDAQDGPGYIIKGIVSLTQCRLCKGR